MRDAKGKFCKGRPFKVGDRVKITRSDCGHSFPVGEIGTVKVDDGSNHMPFIVEAKTTSGYVMTMWMDAEWLALEHGPESTPTSEEPREAVLIRERDEARERRKEWHGEAMRLEKELIETRAEMTENYKNYRKANDRAEAAEAKLADIAALHRAMVLMTDADSFLEAMGKVLDHGNLEAAS